MGGGLTPEDQAAMKLPSSKISPHDPMVRFFAMMCPNVDPFVLLHYAGTFENSLYQWVGNQVKKDQDKAHQAAEDAKKRIQGED